VDPLARVLFAIVLGEAIVIIIIVVPVGTVLSPCLDDAPCDIAIINLLPKIDRGSVVVRPRATGLGM
jgi:hypothetical protein